MHFFLFRNIIKLGSKSPYLHFRVPVSLQTVSQASLGSSDCKFCSVQVLKIFAQDFKAAPIAIESDFRAPLASQNTGRIQRGSLIFSFNEM